MSGAATVDPRVLRWARYNPLADELAEDGAPLCSEIEQAIRDELIEIKVSLSGQRVFFATSAHGLAVLERAEKEGSDAR